MEYLFYYIPQAPDKKWVNANKALSHNYLFFKKNSTRTIILIYLILIVVIIFIAKSLNHYELL